MHGDLALENILVDGRGFVKIIDFGFSYRVGEVARGGTITYAPSEVITFVQDSSPPPQTPQCCDVWSLGVVLFPLLCGHLPFAGASDFEVAASYGVATTSLLGQSSAKLRKTSLTFLCKSILVVALHFPMCPHTWFQAGVLFEA